MEVLEYTKELNPFINMAKFSSAFDGTEGILFSDKMISQRVAGYWYTFSRFMPWLLAHQAASVSTNELRFSFIQIAFEELGEGNRSMIHSEKFLESVRKAGVNVEPETQLLCLEWLTSKLIKVDFRPFNESF